MAVNRLEIMSTGMCASGCPRLVSKGSAVTVAPLRYHQNQNQKKIKCEEAPYRANGEYLPSQAIASWGLL
jgi:hypothetical protein